MLVFPLILVVILFWSPCHLINNLFFNIILWITFSNAFLPRKKMFWFWFHWSFVPSSSIDNHHFRDPIRCLKHLAKQPCRKFEFPSIEGIVFSISCSEDQQIGPSYRNLKLFGATHTRTYIFIYSFIPSSLIGTGLMHVVPWEIYGLFET